MLNFTSFSFFLKNNDAIKNYSIQPSDVTQANTNNQKSKGPIIEPCGKP